MGFLFTADGNILKTADGKYVLTADANQLDVAAPTAIASLTVAYSSSVVPSGGTPAYTFSIVDGALPTGLSINGSSGLISGTPTLVGTFTFSVLVNDSVLGTQIGVFTIFVTSAAVGGSGIYKIIADQTFDELYTIIPSTVQVKIPNVFAETALFGDED